MTKLHSLLADRFCRLIPSAPYHHEQNGVAERANGLVTERSRAMLIDSHLPQELWPELIDAAIHVINRSPTTVNPGKSSAYEQFMSALSRLVKPRLDRLRIFGATTYVHTPQETRPRGQKFAARAQIGYLVGYSEGNNYRIWFPHSNKVIRSAYVLFDEDKGYVPSLHGMGAEPENADEGVKIDVPSAEASSDVPSPVIPPCRIPTIELLL